MCYLVLPKKAQSPEIEIKPSDDSVTLLTTNVNHNYTDCCVQNNVTTSCRDFCDLKTILDGTTKQDPEQCEEDFPTIVKCMAGTKKKNKKNIYKLKIKLKTLTILLVIRW